MKNASWVQHKEVTEANQLEAGKELFMHQCFACHSLGGMNNDILNRTKNMSFNAMRKYLATIHEKRYFMPPFVGNDSELKALAAYLTAGLHKKPLNVVDTVVAENRGKLLYDENCAACHSLDQIKPKMTGWSRDKVRASLDKLSELNSAMPDYTGTPAEKDAMADYMSKQLGGTK